jgi:hypothetical protein
MKPITIPLHLLIPAAVSLAGLIFLLLKRTSLRNKNNALYKSGLIFLFGYALVVGNALGHDIYYQWDVIRYDLNQDGLFSQTETTPAQALAMERLTNDDGRHKSFVSGFIVSAILSLCIYVLIRVNHALFEPQENNNKRNHLNNIHTY